MKNNQKVIIIGAGLCGSLLALRLGQRGYDVTVYEKRPDLRKENISAGRSINLAFSDRGIKAIRLVGLEKQAMELCIPMKGRMLHDVQRNTKLSPYSGIEKNYINSISRGDLNALLMNESEKLDNVKIIFNTPCVAVDFESAEATFRDTISGKTFKKSADVIFGADGAGSALRKSYEEGRKFLFSLSQNFLTHGYKELSILPEGDGGYKIHKNALHIWPREDFMIIALPNLDGSFTVTLFLSYDQGKYNFNNLRTPEEVTDFFQKEFPDALAVMPHLTEEFFENPTSPLGTVKCYPWHYKGKTLLIGDAAHAIVPFYGQGMNASFEDVVVLDRIIDAGHEDWESVFSAYEIKRKPDTDAIADLAIDNFHEMKGHVAQAIFQQKRKIEMALEKEFPESYASKYSLVTFNEDVGYRTAMIQGRAQDKAILTLLDKGKLDIGESLQETLEKIKKETKAILDADRLAGLNF